MTVKSLTIMAHKNLFEQTAGGATCCARRLPKSRSS